MTFKKRTIIMAVVLCATIVIGTISLVSIFAVSQLSGQKANVSVSYTVVRPKNYTGTVSFYLKRAGEESYTCLTQDMDISKESVSSQLTAGIDEEDITLSDASPYFIMCWVFKNTTEESKYYDSVSFTVTPAYTDTGDTNEGVTITSNRSYSNISANKTPEQMDDASIKTSGIGTGYGGIYPGQAVFYYIKVAMKDKYTSVIYDGEFNWTITSQ